MTGPYEKDKLKEWRCDHCDVFITMYHPDFPCYLYREKCPGCKKETEKDRRWVLVKANAA